MQCAECQSPIISSILSTIKDSVVIIHSPLGCASSFVDFNLKFKMGLKKRGLPIKNAKLISSNITEMDVILGIDEKLQKAINKAIKTLNPKVIFITASCGSGTTALDIQNVIDSIQDNYLIPLITVTCELYNSKTWGSGFNSKKAGGFNKLIKGIHKEEKFYNVINFSGNDDIKEILNKIPVKWNHISCYTDYECLEKMGSAQGTLLISADRFSKYIANWLKEEFDIPYINKILPYGIEPTKMFFHQINSWFGEEISCDEIVSCEEKKYLNMLNEIENKLHNIRCLPIIMGHGYEKNILIMLKELNIEIIDYDSDYEMLFDNSTIPFFKKDMNGSLYGLDGVKLSFNQAYVLINSISHINPDLLIVKHYSLRSWGARMGISTLWIENELEFYGYKGMLKFAQKLLDLINNRNFVENIKKHATLPYQKCWMKENLLKKV
ncbi:nitrogenase component 1 [Clostridium kluyveri]|uniref:Nitrogenase iron-molybdenum protein, alpha chain n=2 Tax=Clostridium kluyveri TaxID=1534 RepID=A5N3G5_CLOK5|nr:nitrogenase component 1 [Clostridium kluyveri]EDK35661.1 Nitrogenase iron-molybdenum protein, alpha chain [Clostridium kluyveri DSM 555]BAH08292.1 hypothetical protein CKR_3241 [Clostridium kluyveri NBRC 12016]